MHILLTGSSGYIGRHLARQLAEAEHRVTGLDRDDEGAPCDALDAFVHADLHDAAALERAFSGEVDLVMHLAAAKDDWGLSREEYFRDNVHATRALLEAARKSGVAHHFFYSTVGVHPPGREALDENAPFAPVTPYGASKAEAERLYRQFAREDPASRVTILRPSAVYGPDHPWNTNIYRLVEAIRRRRFVMVGPGRALKTTSHLENLLAATHFLLDRSLEDGGASDGRRLETFIYVDEPAWTTGALVASIYRLLGRRPPSWSVPLAVARPVARVADLVAQLTGVDLPITAARIEKFNRSTNFDASALRQLGFEQPASNADALRRTVAWHRAHV